ncbi:PsbP-related protein [Spongiimicrobium sp. 2-473A-2-J]|uniref:PsbP-related protein n=1 Tax=Eudoraea algarum TaxID=3417568 RepID=UPI003D369238
MKLLVYLLAALSTLSCQEDKMIKLERNGFSISYPSHLTLDESGQEGTSFVLTTQKSGQNDVFVENINLVIKNVGKTSLDEFSKRTENEISTVANIIESNRLKINGKDCFKLVLEATQNNVDLTFVQHYYLENQKVYLLTFSSETKVYYDYYNDMNTVLTSFEIK